MAHCPLRAIVPEIVRAGFVPMPILGEAFIGGQFGPNPRLSGERQEELTNMCSRGVEFFTRPLQIGALTVWNQRNLFM